MTIEASVHWLRGQQGAMEEQIARLVEVNSFTDHRPGGQEVGARLRDLFALPGLTARVVPSERYADHLVFATAAPGPAIGLVGHLDTVFPPGVFEGYRRDGDLARGPGVLDMKGGLVVVAFALRALAAEGLLDRVPLRVVVVADEEVGSPEGQGVIREALAGGQAALVFEAGRAADAIITRRKGTGGLTVTAHGKAAHAGNLHHEGVNAIWALAHFVERAQRLTDYDRGRTVNVGKFTGGQGKNTVPDAAEAQVDIRFTSIADGERLVAELHEAARQAEAHVPGSRLEVHGGALRQPLERSEASGQLARAYGEAAKIEGLGSGEAALLGGGSDACTTSAMGLASIDGLGPRGKGFHTQDEQIEVSTLIPKAAALARFLVAPVGGWVVDGDARGR
jgi:glutamate carboxypeptidase